MGRGPGAAEEEEAEEAADCVAAGFAAARFFAHVH